MSRYDITIPTYTEKKNHMNNLLTGTLQKSIAHLHVQIVVGGGGVVRGMCNQASPTLPQFVFAIVK